VSRKVSPSHDEREPVATITNNPVLTPRSTNFAWSKNSMN
jgi:hypothetical protein